MLELFQGLLVILVFCVAKGKTIGDRKSTLYKGVWIKRHIYNIYIYNI